GLWDLQNPADTNNKVLAKYRDMATPPES
ncbi:MAG TPA: curli production assembly/transport protein CsgG, partial [Atlantibacter hermannii]|nr:curli production assembly/transport protein CsgG [Atlantibacter hermannii]